MFDTHCHLNFKAFISSLDEVLRGAADAGIHYMVVPGTDLVSSKRGIEIAEKSEGIYAAVGVHPHHVYEFREEEMKEVEELLSHPKVVAVGEIGMDKHSYPQTKYTQYEVNETFLTQQKEILRKHIELAKKYKKSVIFHNREAKEETLSIIQEMWDDSFRGRAVLHCCEPDAELLTFVKNHGMFIGVDGDVTYSKEKAEFIKEVPLELLVLETDAPFLLPEPLRTQKKYPNEPKNLKIIAEYVADLKNISIETLVSATTTNALQLFALA